jgi:cellulose synthase/poly-beta-1,6-N-acetylglucosamine synthase-like glycosyltransferase
MLILTVMVALCAVLALAQFALALRVRAGVPSLSALDAPLPTAWPRLSIVVPARNEAIGLEEALRSKLSCEYESLELVVVNDRSTDDTGAIAHRLARLDSRLRVAHIADLPAGWLGKVHAMAVGSARASGDWILFSDADVHIGPGALARILAHAEAHAIDFVSVMPQLDSVDALLDAFAGSLVRTTALAGRIWSANDDRSTIGVGVGVFSLVRRRALEKSPGLEYLRMEIVDDAALGAMLKASGARCRLIAGRSDVHLAFARRLSDLARSMEKGGFLLGSITTTLAVACVWLALDLGIPIAAILAGGLRTLCGAFTLALITATHVVLVRHFVAPARGALFWPLGLVLGVALLARSGILAWWRGAVVWRGTRYSRSELEAGRRWVRGHVRVGRAGTGCTKMQSPCPPPTWIRAASDDR